MFFNFLFLNNFRLREKLQKLYREFLYTLHRIITKIYYVYFDKIKSYFLFIVSYI